MRASVFSSGEILPEPSEVPVSDLSKSGGTDLYSMHVVLLQCLGKTLMRASQLVALGVPFGMNSHWTSSSKSSIRGTLHLAIPDLRPNPIDQNLGLIIWPPFFNTWIHNWISKYKAFGPK
jgi:hypothetical protein